MGRLRVLFMVFRRVGLQTAINRMRRPVMATTAPRMADEVWNREVFRCIIEEGFGNGNLAALDDVAAPEFAEHQLLRAERAAQ